MHRILRTLKTGESNSTRDCLVAAAAVVIMVQLLGSCLASSMVCVRGIISWCCSSQLVGLLFCCIVPYV